MSENALTVALDIWEKDFKEDYIVTVPTKILNKISNNSKGKLKFGMSEYDVTYVANTTSNSIQFSIKFLEELEISRGTITNFNIKENILRLGPVIGVFYSSEAIRKANKQKPTFRIEELMKANKYANTILYCFAIEDIDFINHRIKGTYFNDNTKRWEQKKFSFS